MKTGTKFNVEKSDVSYDFMQNLLDTIPGNAIILDENGIIVCSDSQWIGSAEEFGFFKKTEFKGSDYFEIMSSVKCISEGVEKDLLHEIKNLLHGTSKLLECQYNTKIGDRNFRVSLVAKKSNNKAKNNWITLTYFNITKQKKDGISLQNEYPEFHDAIDQVEIAMAMVSFEGGFLNVNKKFCQIFGYSYKEMLELSYKEITYFEDVHLYSGNIEKLITGEETSFTGEKRYCSKNGVMIWGKITISLIRKNSGEPHYLFAVFEDVSDKLKIETALSESQISYRNLVEQAQDGIALLQNDRVKFVNSAMINLAGYTKEDLIGKPFVSFISDDELARVVEIHRKRLNNEEVPSIYESAIKMKNGGRLDVEFNSRLSDIDGIQIVMIRDISSRKREERKQKLVFDSLQQERNMFISGPVVVFKWNASEGYPVDYVSNNVSEVFGYTKDELTLGEILYTELIYEEDLERVANEVLTFGTGDRNENFIHEPYRIIRKDGELIWVQDHTTIIRNKNGEITNYLGYIVDVSQQRRMEDALRNSEFKYRTLLENIPQKIFLKDKNSVYISCNQNYADDLGLHSSEIKGKTDYDLFPARFAKKFQNDDKRIIKNGKTEELVEEYLQFGKVVLNRVIKTPVRNEEGDTTGVLGIFWDITEQNKTEELLRESEEKFRTLVTNIAEVVYILDNEGKFLLSEGKGLSKLGLEPGEAVGKSIYQLYKNFPDILSNAQKAFRGETVTFEAQVSGRHYRNWYTPYRGQGDEIIGIRIS